MIGASTESEFDPVVSLAGANLSDADLAGEDFSTQDLSETNLAKANLVGTNFADADLANVNFAEADLRDANLAGANLLGANLEGAKQKGNKYDASSSWDCCCCFFAAVVLSIVSLSSAQERAQAADVTPYVEGETFDVKPTGTVVVKDPAYSSGSALKYTSAVTATESVNFSAQGDVIVMARGGQSGGSPKLSVGIDGVFTPAKAVTNSSNTAPQAYTFDTNASAGVHTVGFKASNVGTGRNLFVDKANFDGVPPTQECTTFNAPITISQGGTYTGCWRSTNFNTPAVAINTTQPVIIKNSGIKATGYKIKSAVLNTDLVVQDSYLYGENPNVAGQPTEYGVHVQEPQNLKVENNYFKSTPGVKVHGMYMPRTGTVKVRYNKVENVDARLSNGSGGYQTGQHALRQFFQSDHVVGVPNVEVAWNQIINTRGQSAVEDNINFYLSQGTPTSSITAHDNYIDGAFPNVSASQTSVASYSGSGIVCADGNPVDASEVAAYTRCANNQVLDSLNVGIATPHGHDIELANNRVVGDHDGVQLQSWDPLGMHCQNLSNAPPTHFYNNSIHDNSVAALGNNGIRNDYWLDGDCTESNNVSLATVGEAAEWTFWQNKLSSNSIVLGPR